MAASPVASRPFFGRSCNARRLALTMPNMQPDAPLTRPMTVTLVLRRAADQPAAVPVTSQASTTVLGAMSVVLGTRAGVCSERRGRQRFLARLRRPEADGTRVFHDVRDTPFPGNSGILSEIRESLSRRTKVVLAAGGLTAGSLAHLIHAPSRNIAEAAANQAQLSRRLHDGELASGEAKREPMLSGNRVFVCYISVPFNNSTRILRTML